MATAQLEEAGAPVTLMSREVPGPAGAGTATLHSAPGQFWPGAFFVNISQKTLVAD
jgi:hypothetical protein